MTTADSTTERYAAVMNSLIADCTRLEDRVTELENQLRATARDGHGGAVVVVVVVGVVGVAGACGLQVLCRLLCTCVRESRVWPVLCMSA